MPTVIESSAPPCHRNSVPVGTIFRRVSKFYPGPQYYMLVMTGILEVKLVNLLTGNRWSDGTLKIDHERRVKVQDVLDAFKTTVETSVSVLRPGASVTLTQDLPGAFHDDDVY